MSHSNSDEISNQWTNLTQGVLASELNENLSQTLMKKNFLLIATTTLLIYLAPQDCRGMNKNPELASIPIFERDSEQERVQPKRQTQPLISQQTNIELNLEKLVWKMDNPIKVEKKLVRYLSEKPLSPFIHYLMSVTYLKKYKRHPNKLSLLQKSYQLANQAIELNPRSQFGYLAFAQLLCFVNKPEQSLLILRSAKDKSIASSWRVDYWQIKSYWKIVKKRYRSPVGKNKENLSYLALALNKLEKTIQREKVNLSYFLPLVIEMIRAHSDTKIQLEIIDHWINIAKHDLLLELKAEVLISRGDLKLAKEIYKNLLQQNVSSAKVRLAYAKLLLRSFQQPHQSLRELNSIGEDCCTNALKVQLFKTKAASYFLIDNNEKAQEFFIKALLLSRSPSRYLKTIVESYLDKKEFNNLEKLLEQLAIDMPGHSVVFALLGQVQSKYLKKFQQSIDSFDNALTLAPTKGNYETLKGFSYFHLHQFQNALASFNRALVLNPLDGLAKLGKLSVFSRIKEPTTATTPDKEPKIFHDIAVDYRN